MIDVGEQQTVELIGGYTDAQGTTHRRVTFGRALTCADLFTLDGDPQSESQTQYQLLQMMRKLVEFGTLRLPGEKQTPGEARRESLTLKALLALDTIDLDDLSDAEAEFDAACAGGRTPEALEGNRLRLANGFRVGDAVLDVVEFGRRLTGLDEAQADGQKLRGVARNCYLIGRQISQLSSSEAVAEVKGPVALEMFRQLPVGDFYALRMGAEIFRQTFRAGRGGIQADAPGV
jgi:hypothetical protein